MKSFLGFGMRWRKKPEPQTSGFRRWGGKPIPRLGAVTVFPGILVALCLGLARSTSGQAAPLTDAGPLSISAGATASGYYLHYGEQKMLGISGFIDANTKHRLGIEGEVRWLVFHQSENVHDSTYLIGPRYRMTIRRFQTYAKGLVGLGEFNFPYNNAHGSFLVIAPGGGVDFQLNRRIRLRLADFEYQYWALFPVGAMPSYGVSSGIQVRIF
jgi:hypothetical protein